MDDDDPRMRRSDAAHQLACESLEPYSQDELSARIALLETEITRVKAHYTQAARNRSAADALFAPRATD